MKPTAARKPFELAGYGFIALLVLALLGFWPSYFSKFFEASDGPAFYFHVHATLALLWILLLIVQPILIRKGQRQGHKLLGKLSLPIGILFLVSVILITHHQHSALGEEAALAVFIPFKDLILLTLFYSLALNYKHRVEVHARAMLVCGLVFIEPALVRLLSHSGISFPGAYYLTIATVFSLLVGLIIAERHQQKARWIFPTAFGLYILFHTVIVFELPVPFWKAFARWFLSLPLT